MANAVFSPKDFKAYVILEGASSALNGNGFASGEVNPNAPAITADLLKLLKKKKPYLERLSKDELKSIAKKKNIKGISNKSRDELITLLGRKNDNIESNVEATPANDPNALVSNIRQLEQTAEQTSIYDMTTEELQNYCKSRGMKTYKRRRNELIEWLEMNNENEQFDHYLTDNENVL